MYFFFFLLLTTILVNKDLYISDLERHNNDRRAVSLQLLSLLLLLGYQWLILVKR